MYNSVSEILKEYTSSWENVYFTDPVTGQQAVVSPPYVLNDDNYINASNRDNSKNWERDDGTGYLHTLDYLQNILQDPDGVDQKDSTRGKCRPDIIKRFLEIEGENLWNEGFTDYREALKYYGIGIDCSGFVSRAIARVMNEYDIDPSIRVKTLGLSKHSKYKSNTTTLCCFKDGSNELSSGTGHKPVSPTDLRPGDILFNKNGSRFHIRIVIDVFPRDNAGYYFQTAEASSVKEALKVIRKDWWLDNDGILYSSCISDRTKWKKIPEWNVSNGKSLYHFGRPLAFWDLESSEYRIQEPEQPTPYSDSSMLNEGDITFGITRGNVNLRPSRSKKGLPLCVIPLGTIFRVDLSEGLEGEDGLWYPVEYDGFSGYLSSVTFNADLSPVCTGYVSPDTPLASLIAAFNSDAAARRVFDEVHYYDSDPHLTLGFGHFAGGTQDEFIHSMLSHDKMRSILTNAFAKAFVGNPSFVTDARAEGNGMLSLNDGSLHGLDEFLTNLNLERGSVNRNNKNKFPGGGKKNGYWLNDILVDVLKDNVICAWQVRFWAAHTLADAMKFAVRIGLADNYGAVATLTSLRSSGLMHEASILSQISGLDNDAAAMKLWTYYNKAKGSETTRGRQKTIFSKWYSRSWKITSHVDCPKDLSDCTRLNMPMEKALDGIAFNPDENRDDYFNSLLDFILE